MTGYKLINGIQVDSSLAEFLEKEVLKKLGRDPTDFWKRFCHLLDEFVPRNLSLLKKREEIQTKIDFWHQNNRSKKFDISEYKKFLKSVGYLADDPGNFQITTKNVDEEIATLAGPQLVVPVLNSRFLLNAANARWGSLYDAFYGTDALDAPPAKPGAYDKVRGAAVIARGRQFLDQSVPLDEGVGRP